jgi:methionyl-tRNA synthetase
MGTAGCVQDSQFWKLPKEEAATVVAAALGLVKVLAAMLQPFLPTTARAMDAMLNAPPAWATLGESFATDAAALQVCHTPHA